MGKAKPKPMIDAQIVEVGKPPNGVLYLHGHIPQRDASPHSSDQYLRIKIHAIAPGDLLQQSEDRLERVDPKSAQRIADFSTQGFSPDEKQRQIARIVT